MQDNWISSMKGRRSLQKYLRCKWKGKTSRGIEISKFRGKIIPRRCKPIFEYRRQQDGRNSSGNNSSQSFIDDTIVACNSLNGRLSHGARGHEHALAFALLASANGKRIFFPILWPTLTFERMFRRNREGRADYRPEADVTWSRIV